MTTAFILIGIPASGKTTWMWEQLNNPTFDFDLQMAKIVSSDHIRYMLTGDESDQSKNNLVWPEFYKAVKVTLASDRNVITDSTSAKASDRRKLIACCRDHGVEQVHGIFFKTELSVCKKRNLLRPRVVPEYVLERMFAQLESDPPQVSDGFDTLTVIEDNHVQGD